MRVYIIAFFCLLSNFFVISNAYGQYGPNEWSLRIGSGKDSIDVYNMYSTLSSSYIKTKREYDLGAYKLVSSILAKAPRIDYFLYSTNFIENFWKQLISKEDDKAIKMIYFEDMMATLDRLIWDRDYLNKLRFETNLRNHQSDGTARVNKAHYYFAVGKKEMSGLSYNADSAYFYFKDAFSAVRNSEHTEGSDEILGVYLWEYFDSSYDLYKNDNERYQEQFLQDYLDCIDACDKMLEPAYEETDSAKQMDIFAKYWHHKDTIQKVFVASGSASPERLNDFYGRKFAENRNNHEYLERAINFMNENNCVNIDAFYTYCETSYAIKPTWLNCLGCAYSSKALGMRNEMFDYYRKAMELSTNDLIKGLVANIIANEISITPRPKDFATDTLKYHEWIQDMNIAETYLKEVINYKDAFLATQNDKRLMPAHAAYKLGNLKYYLAAANVSLDEIDASINYYNEAKELASFDPIRYNDVTGEIERAAKMKEQIQNRKSTSSSGNMNFQRYRESLNSLRKTALGELFMTGRVTPEVLKYEDYYNQCLKTKGLIDANQKRQHETYLKTKRQNGL